MTYRVYGVAGGDTKQLEFINIYSYDETIQTGYVTTKEYIDAAVRAGLEYWDIYGMIAIVFKEIKDSEEEAENLKDSLCMFLETQNTPKDAI